MMLSTFDDFLGSVGPFLTVRNPLEALKQAGFVLGGDLARAFDRSAPPPFFGPDALARLQAVFGPPPPISLHVGRQPILPPSPPNPGGFRAVVSARLEVLNSVLAELWRVGTIPQEFTADQTAEVVTIEDLRDACTGVPDPAELGHLALTQPPVASPGRLTPLDMHFAIPFNLPVDAGFTSLRGTVQLEQPLGFEIAFPDGRSRIRLTGDAIDNLKVQLEISPLSALQLRSEEKRAALERKIVAAMGAVWRSLFLQHLTLAFPAGIEISNSFPNSRVDISQLGVATLHAGGGDFVIAGINVESNPTTDDPTVLVNAPLPHGASNLHAVILQSFATDALSAAITSGDMEAFINRVVQRHVDASHIAVNGGSITFEDGFLRLSIECTGERACPLGKDLDFTASLTASLAVRGDTLAIESSHVVLDLDDFDAVVCTLLSAFLGPFAVVFTVGVLAFLALFNPDGKSIEFPATDNSEPLPGSDQDFKVRLNRASVTRQGLLADGSAGLVQDTLRAFVCLRLVTELPSGGTAPLARATVELLELDSPAPAADDVVIPETGEVEIFTKKFVINEATSYRELPDLSLGTRITDDSGFVRFVSRMRSAAGIFTTITSTEDLTTGKLLSTRTRTDLIDEAQPDFAINVTADDGTVVARRQLVALNNPGRRLGTKDEPLVVRVSSSGVLV
jgi:hypothetical protein